VRGDGSDVDVGCAGAVQVVQVELGEVCLEAYMRMIILADDPDPERVS